MGLHKPLGRWVNYFCFVSRARPEAVGPRTPRPAAVPQSGQRAPRLRRRQASTPRRESEGRGPRAEGRWASEERGGGARGGPEVTVVRGRGPAPSSFKGRFIVTKALFLVLFYNLFKGKLNKLVRCNAPILNEFKLLFMS